MCAAKREAWEVEETRFLLRLICAKQVLKPLDRKRFRAADIFQHLEEPMHERRYLKNGKQMQTRFKTFRFQYNRYKRQLNRSGEENCRPDFPFFEEMNVLLGDRPISQLEGVDFAQSSKESNSESDQADYQDAGVTLTNDDLQHDTTDQALEDDDDVQDSEEPTPKRRRYSDKGGRRSYQQHLENYAKIQKHNSLEVQKVVLQKQIESVAELFQQQREFEADLIKKLYGAAERNSGHYCLGLHNNVCNSIGIYFNNT
ncbi:hypothetical protein RN001_008920 [Aquatica leii]|uniref:Myb/SANT-like DNA-binding domain-containing protein n=1 Tax=Aquatica leii TaxID=1421715 RepID=A0AAN7PXW5_9COLE|nr:hypothetical protein RN001_008920 [Aquatica leii]